MNLKSYLTLFRVSLSLFAACSAATGFFLSTYNRIFDVLFPSSAVFFLACGASALNQYQERDLDASMDRTRKRPLPSGALNPSQAFGASIAMIATGLIVLALANGATPAILGGFALFWYNGVYTPLKRITAFAAVPGAAVGMVPPAIGWVSAGGSVIDPQLVALCFIFFMWQVPHFWLLVLRHGEEYRKAGLPSLTGKLNTAQIGRITYAWIVAAAAANFALPLYGSIRTPVGCLLLVPPALWLVWNERSLAGGAPFASPPPLLFRKINIYLFIMMSLLAGQSIYFHAP